MIRLPEARGSVGTLRQRPDLRGPHSHGDDAFRVLRVLRLHTPNLSLQVAKTPVTAHELMHLDLYSDDPMRQVGRLLDLGATWLREHNHPEDRYAVMPDLEGNEFCVFCAG